MGFTVVPSQAPISAPPGASSNYPGSNVSSPARERAIQAVQALGEGSQAAQVAESLAANEESRQSTNIEVSEAGAPAQAAPKAASPAEKPLSSEYAILARKEKALRARAQQLSQREAELKAKETPAPSTPSFDESKYISKDRLKQDLFGTISELGMTYDDVTAQALNAPTPEQLAFTKQIKALEAKIAELEGNTNGIKKSFEQQQTDARSSAEKQITFEVQSLVKHNPEFETIKETNSVRDVVDLISSVYDKGLGNPDASDFIPPGTLLSAEEASRMVEDHLVAEALKLAKLKKIQSKLMPQAPKAVPQKTTDVPKQSQSKTLTNSLTSNQKPLSARERAILVGEGKLAPSWKR